MSQGYSQRIYTQAEAEKFVKYLCCWTRDRTLADIANRDPKDYREALLKLIEANKTRKDQIGLWETLAALKELDKLNNL